MHQETWCNGSIGGSNPSGQRSSRCVFAKKSRVDVIGNMPDSESGLKSSSLLLAAMRIGVVGNTRAFDSRVEIYWVRIPHPQPGEYHFSEDKSISSCLRFYINNEFQKRKRIMLIIFILIALCIGAVFLSMYTVPENHVYIISRAGQYHQIAGPGRHFKIPFVDQIANKISMNEQVLVTDSHQFISWDNITDDVVCEIKYKVTSPQSYTYCVDNPLSALELLAITTARNVLGEALMRNVEEQYETLNNKIFMVVKEQTVKWGIDILDLQYKKA